MKISLHSTVHLFHLLEVPFLVSTLLLAVDIKTNLAPCFIIHFMSQCPHFDIPTGYGAICPYRCMHSILHARRCKAYFPTCGGYFGWCALEDELFLGGYDGVSEDWDIFSSS